MTIPSAPIAVVTGSASGIGAAVAARLRGQGMRVIGIDRRDAEVIADLATGEGRAAAIAAAAAQAGDRIDALVACAGVGPQTEPVADIVAINYFGAVAVLDGLRPLLAHGARPAAVAVGSNSASIVPGADGALSHACLAGDESAAALLAADLHGALVYAASKFALARWVRRQAVSTEWAGAGIRLNAVAPGAVRTPLLEAGLAHPVFGDGIRTFPIPLGSFAEPDQVAAVITFLLSPEASFCCGSVWYVDGGSDALIHP